ncbi:hypothetical protein MKW98_011953 [Papaver atlanticum]|uniref:Uncharacterized protein n=1 Tax=Papaver atlanticum TaxID=357466 RepID=A0AAD4S4E1_9MAGN|nr:hypothetical protein MKW98_011953 [Papaver atlanticum]
MIRILQQRSVRAPTLLPWVTYVEWVLLDADRQKYNTGVHDQIPNSSYQQSEISEYSTPLKFERYLMKQDLGGLLHYMESSLRNLTHYCKYKSRGMGTCVDDILITNVIGYWNPSNNFDVWSLILRNLRKRLAASVYVDSAKLLNDGSYECIIDEIIDPRVMLCDRVDVVLGDVSRGDMINWPKAYVN